MSIQITQLPITTSVTDSTVLLVVNNNISEQITGSTLKSYLGGFGSSTGINVMPFTTSPLFDLSLGQTQKLTLTGNVSSSNTLNGVPTTYIFIIDQDTVGSHTFTWPSNFIGAGTINNTTLAGDPNAINIQQFIFDTTVNMFFAVGTMITYITGSGNTSQDLQLETSLDLIYTENLIPIST